MCINSFGAVVGDNDGAAFITKAEFESLKNVFQAQINKYNASIDNKIDGAIASYIAGINVAKDTITNNLCYDEDGVLSVRANYDDINWKEGFIYLTEDHYQIFNKNNASATDTLWRNGISIGKVSFTSNAQKEFTDPSVTNVDRTNGFAIWNGVAKTKYAIRSNSFDRNLTYNIRDFGIQNNLVVWEQIYKYSNVDLTLRNVALYRGHLGYWRTATDFYATNNYTPYTFNSSISKSTSEVGTTSIILTPASATFKRFVDYDYYKDWSNDTDTTGHTTISSASQIWNSVIYEISQLNLGESGFATFNENPMSSVWDAGNYGSQPAIQEVFPFFGFVSALTNWNQIANKNWDSVAKVLDNNYDSSGRVYVDSKNTKHMLICAGAPVCEVKNGNIVCIDVVFDDKDKDYDVWFCVNGWKRNAAIENDSVLPRSHVYLDKELKTKASSGSYGSKSVKVPNGEKTFYVDIPEEGVLFVKWSYSGNSAAGGGKYLPNKTVIVTS